VSVNGTVVTALGRRADPARDAIAVDGERIRVRAPVTIALHKPRGVVTTLRDPEGRPTVSDLVADVGERVYPIGRLDLQSSGLVLLTNDGALAAGLQHPRYGVARVYQVKVQGTPSPDTLLRLRRGVRLEDGRAAASRVRVVESRATKTWLELELREGRWREVRRMCDAVGHPVDKLVRVRVGPIALGTLPEGRWRALGADELRALYEAAGLKWAGGKTGGDGGPGRARRGRGKRRNTPAGPRAGARPREGRSGPAPARERRAPPPRPRRSRRGA
jgi:23S rRNA pseudouridine2605 synthase